MSFISGEPQEECIRCGKMYVLSSELNNSKGACGKCLGITKDSLKGEQLRSSGESGTEEEEMDEEEELSNGGIEYNEKKLFAT